MPFPLIVLAAALFGFLRASTGRHARSGARRPIAKCASVAARCATVAVWLAIWIVPLAALAAVFGPTTCSRRSRWFFSKLAVVTFGGAYAVLAYMAQDVVQPTAG